MSNLGRTRIGLSPVPLARCNFADALRQSEAAMTP
jgi:hypothetical protein